MNYRSVLSDVALCQGFPFSAEFGMCLETRKYFYEASMSHADQILIAERESLCTSEMGINRGAGHKNQDGHLVELLAGLFPSLPGMIEVGGQFNGNYTGEV